MANNIDTKESAADFVRQVFPLDGVPNRLELILTPRVDDLELLDAFAGKRWVEFSTKDLRLHEEALSVFTPRALAYYLPAFLTAVLLDRVEADILEDDLIGLFTPDSDSGLWRSTALKRVLTPDQIDAIRRFLRIMNCHQIGYPSAEAWLRFVEHFWGGCG
jgi:hypothetical protein